MKDLVISHFEVSEDSFGLTEEQVSIAIHKTVDQLGVSAFRAFLNDYKLTPELLQCVA